MTKRRNACTAFTSLVSKCKWQVYWGRGLKVEVKFSLCVINQASCHEDVSGSESIDPLFLTSAPDGGQWSASRPFRFIPQGTRPRYPLDRRLGGVHSRSGRCGEEKNIFLLPGMEPNSSAFQPITILTELSQGYWNKWIGVYRVNSVINSNINVIWLT
jgi:hypothetical protein